MVLLARLRLARSSRLLRFGAAALFDAYGRGGALSGSHLVLAPDFFRRPVVVRVFSDYLAGRAVLEMRALERGFLRDGSVNELPCFKENVTHFVGILARPRLYRVRWRGPDGRPVGPGSAMFD